MDQFDSSSSSAAIDGGRVSAQADQHSPPTPRRSYRQSKSTTDDLFQRKLVTVAPHDIDHHEWVKYGEKKIIGYKFHRCYYRCTYHRDGCRAKKQVQQQEHGDPPSYAVTYSGEHACRNTALSTLLDRRLMIRDCISKAQQQLQSHSTINAIDLLNFDSSSCCNASYPDDVHRSSPTESFPLSSSSSSNPHGASTLNKSTVDQNPVDVNFSESFGIVEDDQQKNASSTLNESSIDSGNANNISESSGKEVEPGIFADLDYGFDDLFCWNGMGTDDDAIISGDILQLPWDHPSGVCKETGKKVAEEF